MEIDRALRMLVDVPPQPMSTHVLGDRFLRPLHFFRPQLVIRNFR
ncbi:hypothetical protein [Saccharopolyspora sp. NPDC002686]